MPNELNDLRQRLLDVQEVTPALRDAYRHELTAMLEQRLTSAQRMWLWALLVALLAFTAIGMRALLVAAPGPFIYGVWATFTIMCAGGAVGVGWSIGRGRFLWSSYFRFADAFTVAAAALTVLALGSGLRTPVEAKSIFGPLYGFLLLAMCIAWSLHNRISAAELAAREQFLRIECRLAELTRRQLPD